MARNNRWSQCLVVLMSPMAVVSWFLFRGSRARDPGSCGTCQWLWAQSRVGRLWLICNWQRDCGISFSQRAFVKAMEPQMRPLRLQWSLKRCYHKLRGKCAISLCHKTHPLGTARGQWQELLNVPGNQCPKHSSHWDSQTAGSGWRIS